MINFRNKKFLKAAALITTIVLIAMVGLTFFGCFGLTGGSTTTATNPDGTPIEQSWLAKYGTWIWLVVLVVAFYFLLIRPQRQRAKTQQDLLGNMQKGDEVVTVGGIFGKIKDVGGDSLIITISSGVDVKVSKSAIARKIMPDVTTGSSDAFKK